MKFIGAFSLAALLVATGVTLAQQSADQKKGSSMMESMPDMMKGKRSGEGGMHGMGDMGGMMRMMKMMHQCAAMMEPAHDSGAAKEDQKK
jgi:hypothetical protein